MKEQREHEPLVDGDRAPHYVSHTVVAGLLPALLIRSGRTTKLVLQHRSAPATRDRRTLAA
jgi:hypothetical protein